MMLVTAWGAMMMAELVRLARCAMSVRPSKNGERPKTSKLSTINLLIGSPDRYWYKADADTAGDLGAEILKPPIFQAGGRIHSRNLGSADRGFSFDSQKGRTMRRKEDQRSKASLKLCAVASQTGPPFSEPQYQVLQQVTDPVLRCL